MNHLAHQIHQHRKWLAVVLLVVVASIGPLLLAPVQASGSDQDLSSAAQLGSSQIFSDDLTVDEGEVIRSNVVVYDGDAEVKDGGRIEGNLVVYSGNVEIREGGVVAGDVSAFSGDVKVQGRVEGDIASWSGDVDLEKAAHVEGDISVLSGDIKRDDRAYVGGNVVRGPSFNLKVPAMIPPLNPGDGFPGSDVVITSESSNTSFFERIGNFFLRLFIGFGITIIFVPLAGLIAYSKPDYLAAVDGAIRRQTALAFAIGLMTNVIIGLLTAFLVMTLCLALFAVLPFFVLVGLNVVGWTAVAGIVGKRIGRWLQLDVSMAVLVILGAVALAALIVPFFALGGCFRIFAFVAALLIGAFGVGGVIVAWREQRSGRTALPPTEPQAALEGPTESTSETTALAPSESSDQTDGSIDVGAEPTEEPADIAPVEDDFTEIDGVNAVMDARLKVAGVRTFRDLAEMTPEAVADVFSWTVAEVESVQIIEKARLLSGL